MTVSQHIRWVQKKGTYNAFDDDSDDEEDDSDEDVSHEDDQQRFADEQDTDENIGTRPEWLLQGQCDVC